MNEQTKHTPTWRSEVLELGRQQYIYRVLEHTGNSLGELIVCENATAGKSEGTRKRFEQISREHNEYEALCAVAEAAKAAYYTKRGIDRSIANQSLEDALANLAALRNQKSQP